MRPFRYYKLDRTKDPPTTVAVESVVPGEWGMEYEEMDRRVALTEVGLLRVSTIFLSIDHSFGMGGVPILFETMVFPQGRWNDLFCCRYSTWNEAVLGHRKTVRALKRNPRCWWWQIREFIERLK